METWLCLLIVKRSNRWAQPTIGRLFKNQAPRRKPIDPNNVLITVSVERDAQEYLAPMHIGFALKGPRWLRTSPQRLNS